MPEALTKLLLEENNSTTAMNSLRAECARIIFFIYTFPVMVKG